MTVNTRDALEGLRVCVEAPCGEPEPVIVAVAAAVRRYRPSIYATCLRVVADPSVAVALTRDVVREIYRRLPEIVDDAAPPRAWFHRVAQRIAFDAVRRWEELWLEDGLLATGSAAARALREMSLVERRSAFADALGVLDPPGAELARLRYVENLPWRVIDRWTGTSGSERAFDGHRSRFSTGLEAALV